MTSECDICQQVARASSLPRVTMPSDKLSFNSFEYYNLMFIDGNAIVHVGVHDTASSAAAFAKSKELDAFWLLHCCI